MAANVPEIASFNVIKGFLNLSLDSAFWAARFAEVAADERFGQAPATGRTVMVYSSPNTNKPLHHRAYPQQPAAQVFAQDQQPYGHSGERRPSLRVEVAAASSGMKAITSWAENTT